MMNQHGDLVDTMQIKSLLISGLLILSLCACGNTVSGFGKDVENTGRAITKLPEE